MPPELRIAYWQPFHLPSDHAHGIQVLHTCRALAEAGCRVALSVKRNPAQPVQGFEEALAAYGLAPHPNLRLRWLPTRHNGIQGVVARLRARRVHGPGWVHYARHLRLARSAAAAGHAPVVLELHKLEPAALRAARVADGVVCISEPLRRAVAAELAPHVPSVCIPDAVDPLRFHPPDREGPGRLVYVGQLHEWKGVDVMLRALVALPGVAALVIGGRRGVDPRRAALQAQAAQLGVTDRVEWTGYLPQAEVPGRLRRGDVGIVPTRAANGQDLAASPLKLFEYLASGLAVVASDLPALRDVLRHDENALLFPEGDAAALAAQARRALDPATAVRLAEAGRTTARRHSWAARAQAIQAFLERVRAATAGDRPA